MTPAYDIESNQEDICNTKLSGLSGISILDKYLDQLYLYLKDFGSESDETLIGPHKILVPVVGSFMHCAENGKLIAESFLIVIVPFLGIDAIRVQMRNNDLVKKLLVVLTSINNIMVKTNVFHIELLIVMSGLLFNLTIESKYFYKLKLIFANVLKYDFKYTTILRTCP